MEITAGHSGPWYLTDPHSANRAKLAQRALRKAFNRDVALIREGGSIPIVSQFRGNSRHRNAADGTGAARLPRAFAQREFSARKFRRRHSSEQSNSAGTRPLILFAATKVVLRSLLIAAICFGINVAPSRAEESLGTKIKRFLTTTPTPTPARKHRKRSARKSDAHSIANCFAKTEEDFAHSNSNPTPKPNRNAEKARPSANAHSRRNANAESNGNSELTPSATARPTPQKKGAPNVTVSPEEIAGLRHLSRESAPTHRSRA